MCQSRAANAVGIESSPSKKGSHKAIDTAAKTAPNKKNGRKPYDRSADRLYAFKLNARLLSFAPAPGERASPRNKLADCSSGSYQRRCGLSLKSTPSLPLAALICGPERTATLSSQAFG